MLTVNDLRLPRSYQILAAADTGTYMSGLISALSPELDLYCLEEFPNYRYVGDGTIELTGETVGEWMKRFALRLRYWTKERKNAAWVDANTTFKTEVGYGLRFKMNRKPLELRTEITREYVRNGRVHLMPWLEVLPYELQEAKFPDHETAGTGRFQRIKIKDHTLDDLEHICSRRPHPDFTEAPVKKERAIDRFVAQHKRHDVSTEDPHLGAN